VAAQAPYDEAMVPLWRGRKRRFRVVSSREAEGVLAPFANVNLSDTALKGLGLRLKAEASADRPERRYERVTLELASGEQFSLLRELGRSSGIVALGSITEDPPQLVARFSEALGVPQDCMTAVSPSQWSDLKEDVAEWLSDDADPRQQAAVAAWFSKRGSDLGRWGLS